MISANVCVVWTWFYDISSIRSLIVGFAFMGLITWGESVDSAPWLRVIRRCSGPGSWPGMAASGFLRLTWSVPGLTELLSPAQIPAPLGSSRHSSVTGSAMVSPSTSSSRGSFSPLDPCFAMVSSSPLPRVIGEDMVEFLSTTTSECTRNLKYLKQRANTCVCTYSATYLPLGAGIQFIWSKVSNSEIKNLFH